MKKLQNASHAWQPVPSSLVDAFAYDPKTRQLKVRIAGTEKVYLYHGVDQRVVEEMLSADSVGGYFNSEIRDGYRYERI